MPSKRRNHLHIAQELAQKRSSGFTMIELLMVMMLVAVLGAIAIPQFLDFRAEARIATLRQNLIAIRSGIQNQVQQTRLKCNARAITTSYWQSLYGHILTNDITSSYGGSTASRLCSPAQVTNTADRKFWNINDYERASIINAGTVQETRFLPRNPFVSGNYTWDIAPTANLYISINGGQCGTADYFITSFPEKIHWFFNEDTGDVFPGTNTPGINECNF